MAVEITVPRLGWSMEEAIFSAWLKQPGDSIRAGDLLFAIESDKATQEIESLDSGTLHVPQNAPKQGEKVLVGQLLGYLLAEGESAPARTTSHATSEGIEAPLPTPAEQQVRAKSETPASTPRARRVARELGVEWSQVPGTGRDGRICEADIRAQVPAALSSARRVIAERMLTSQQKTAAVTLHTTADATELVRLRAKLKSSGGEIVPTYNDMLMKLTAAALRAHPRLNSRWDGENLRTLPDIHIGLAVDTEPGLLVPVIRDVATLSLQGIANRSADLINRARSAKVSVEELREGTFTITSLGSFGIDAFTPIINYPECAILGVGRILRQPVADGDSIILRDVISLSLTFDHRAFDGAPAARFLQTIVRLIETPKSLS